MTKHLPCTPALHLQYLCCVFMLKQAHFSWVGRSFTRWSSLSKRICSRTLCCDAAKPVGRAGDSRRGPRARNALSIARHWDGEKIVDLVQSFLREPVAECNNLSNKYKDGPRTFLWKNGSAVPVDVLVRPINPAHGLVVVFDYDLMFNVHPFPIRSRPSFDFVDWVDTSLVGDSTDDSDSYRGSG